MTDAAKRVLDALAEVVRLRRYIGTRHETDRTFTDRQNAFKRLWVAYDDYEREQPPLDHGYGRETTSQK